MIVYLHGSRQLLGEHIVRVCPGRDPETIAGEVPSEWKAEDGEPLDIPVRFFNGRAKVPDNLGRYLLKAGIAHKAPPSSLILPGKGLVHA